MSKRRHNKRGSKCYQTGFFLFLILKFFKLNFAFLYTIPKLFNFDWFKKWNDFTCLDATMKNICLDDVTKKVCCVWRQRQFFALAFPWLTMKLHDCRPVDNLVKLQTKDDGLPLVFALFVNSSGVYSTKKYSEILLTKNNEIINHCKNPTWFTTSIFPQT